MRVDAGQFSGRWPLLRQLASGCDSFRFHRIPIESTVAPASISAAFLPPDSALAALIAQLDWASTPLGPIDQWPQHLCCAVGIVLHSPKPIALLWGEAGIMIYNDAYAVVAGGRHPACLGQPLREAWPEVSEFNDRLMKTVLAGKPQSFEDHEFTFLRNGSPESVWLTLDYSPVPDAGGGFAGVMATVTETTGKVMAERELRKANQTLEARIEERTRALVEAEDALRQAQKMEAIGQLTGGIAHDFNNLLGTLKVSFELLELRMRSGDTQQAQRYVTVGKETVERAASLTQRLLAFSRRQTLDPRRIDLRHRLNQFEELVRRSVGPSIAVQFNVPADLWPVRADSAQLENALLNLCINARDAMQPGGGSLTVTGNNCSFPHDASTPIGNAPGDYVCLEVRDTGCGMDAQTKAHATEPFFTTKPLGQGTGLGLSMVYGFARQSGGQMRIESELGQGTTVSIYMPRIDGDSNDTEAAVGQRNPTSDTAAFSAPRSARVLLIEDEAPLRALLQEELVAAGYEVTAAADGREGLACLDDGPNNDLQILITDVGLPGGMNGRQVADVMRLRKPDLKVLFITGYAAGAAVGNGLLEPGMEVMTKPFELGEFKRRIAQMLAP
jgi:PAS domain S-box-containing protein